MATAEVPKPLICVGLHEYPDRFPIKNFVAYKPMLTVAKGVRWSVGELVGDNINDIIWRDLNAESEG